MNKICSALLVSACSSVLFAGAEQVPEPSTPAVYNPPIKRIALFEKSPAFVERTIESDQLAPGAFYMTSPFEPVYGSLSVSTPELSLTSRRIKLAKPNLMPLADLSSSFANREITVYLNDDLKSVVSGVALPPLKDENGEIFANSLRLKDKLTGRISFINPNLIYRVDAASYQDQLEVAVPVLEIVKNSRLPEGTAISYLTNGFSWYPTYQLHLAKDVMTVEMAAVVSNQLEAVRDAECFFVLGAPGVDYAGQLSALAFSRLMAEQPEPLYPELRAESASTNDAYMRKSLVAAAASVPPPQYESATGDVVYLVGGKLTLGKNEARRIPLALKTGVPFERIVELEIPESLDRYGNRINFNDTDRKRWRGFDAIRFRNPLNIPMSQAAVSIYDDGRFSGETRSSWCNPGETATVRIARAQSIALKLKELEIPNTRQNDVIMNGMRYYRIDAEGVLEIRNFRSADAKIFIKYNLRGQVTDAPDAKVEIFPNSSDVNPQNLVSFDITVPGGGEKTLKVKYRLYVRY